MNKELTVGRKYNTRPYRDYILWRGVFAICLAYLAVVIGAALWSCAKADTLDPAFVYISDGALDSPCSCWADNTQNAQVCVDKTAINGPFLTSRMVFWAQHGTNITFAFYTGKCTGTGRLTIGTATTPGQ